MQRIRVDSSCVSSIAYKGTTLEIEFTSGELYQYYNVPKKEYDDFMSAPSHGAYFAEHIRNHYRYCKIIMQNKNE